MSSGELRVRVVAAPVDGAANAALVRLLASALDVPPGRIRLAGGAASRRKLVDIDLEPGPIRSRWPDLDV